MATFVLVHGAWHGGWCWSRVRKRLQHEGHEVHAPTLSGLCERSHLLSPEIGLGAHVADVANLIRWEGLTDVVLCGHSYGGCVISGAAHELPDRMAALVYLDAFVLDDGQSLFATLPEAMQKANLDLAREEGAGWKIPPVPAANFNVNEADRDWVDAQCTAQPLLSFTQALGLERGLPNTAKKSFIYASGWGETPFRGFRDKATSQGWHVTDVDCGHDVMIDEPARLTELLVEAARL